MNLVEKLPLKNSLSEQSIKDRIKVIDRALRQRRMPMLYELIAYCEFDVFVNAVKDCSICPSYFNLRCNCTRNGVPMQQREQECIKCWEKCIENSHWRFGGKIYDEDTYEFMLKHGLY